MALECAEICKANAEEIRSTGGPYTGWAVSQACIKDETEIRARAEKENGA